MRLRKLTLLTALALSLNPLLPASALGFMEAYRAALQNDPTYQAAIAENEAGQQNRAMGRAGLLPQISANASRARVRGEREYNTQTLSEVRNVIEPLSYFSTSRTVQVRQSVLNMAAIANFRQGRARAEYSTEVFRGKQNDLALRLSSAYFQALLSQHAIDLAQAKVQSIEQQLKTAEVQFKAGDGTVTDVDEARARRDLAQAQLIEARNQLTVAMRSLQELVGDKPVSLAQLKADFAKQLKPELETLDTWLDRALETSADIAAQRRALEVAEREVDKNRAGHLPTVDVYASSGRSQSDSFSSINQEYRTRQLGVQVNIPIFSGGYTNAATTQAIANRERARNELEATVNKTHIEVTKQYSGTVSGLAKVQALELAVKSSEQALESTKMGFKAGMRSNVDILNAEEQLYTSRRDLAEAKYVYLLSRLRLKAAAGQLSEADMGEVDSYFGAEKPVHEKLVQARRSANGS
ncbi:TolC family outer membrane protein [Rivihabitans pingtungensis]|uniref:TolC family outer membrane protein n=2 Tax=Rivihabitans pingtungensis TaxID=1054498 RepID=UPI0023F18B03|nr:TolC family outer membrane protein [Rivihabitans pingtungensis]